MKHHELKYPIHRRNAENDRLLARERRGHYGTSAADEATATERVDVFTNVILQKRKTQLKIVSQNYEQHVRKFLLQLACSQDQSLQCLSFRLDFNQHYKRSDASLGTPLTFQHKRESMMLTRSSHV